MLCQQRRHGVDKLGQLVPVHLRQQVLAGREVPVKGALSHTRRLGDPVKLQVSDCTVGLTQLGPRGLDNTVTVGDCV
jgi:hypothetical protein